MILSFYLENDNCKWLFRWNSCTILFPKNCENFQKYENIKKLFKKVRLALKKIENRLPLAWELFFKVTILKPIYAPYWLHKCCFSSIQQPNCFASSHAIGRKSFSLPAFLVSSVMIFPWQDFQSVLCTVIYSWLCSLAYIYFWIQEDLQSKLLKKFWTFVSSYKVLIIVP